MISFQIFKSFQVYSINGWCCVEVGGMAGKRKPTDILQCFPCFCFKAQPEEAQRGLWNDRQVGFSQIVITLFRWLNMCLSLVYHDILKGQGLHRPPPPWAVAQLARRSIWYGQRRHVVLALAARPAIAERSSRTCAEKYWRVGFLDLARG